MEACRIVGFLYIGSIDFCCRVPLCAVCIQKRAGDVDDLHAVPVEHQMLRIRDPRHNSGIEVFGMGKLNKLFSVTCGNYNSHALLRFAYCKLSRIEPVVLFENCIEVDIESGRKLTNSYANTAGTEVITALYQACGFMLSEEPLKLPFLRGIALLHLCTAIAQRLFVVRF